MKVLVAEKIADAGVELLREQFDVELGLEWDGDELGKRIGEFDGILIRSATKLTSDLIGRAERLKVIGRAGTGVDNVDVDAATKRGIVVANAPEANSIAAAEHTLALMLALCRNIPQAHASLAAGNWDRSRFKGTELYGKTLGVLGFGRIGQLVAARNVETVQNGLDTLAVELRSKIDPRQPCTQGERMGADLAVAQETTLDGGDVKRLQCLVLKFDVLELGVVADE